MQAMNLLAFFIGTATLYFTMWALLTLTRPQRSRYQTVLGCIFVVWAVFTCKDIILTFPQFYTRQIQNYIVMLDGWSAITYTVFIFELVMPGWTTWRRLLVLAVPWQAFTMVYLLWPTDGVLWAYIAFLWCYAWSIVAIAFVKARRYIRYIRSNYSNIDDIDISWLRHVFWFCIVSQLAWLAASLLYNVYSDILYYVSSMVMWQMVIHYSYHFQPVTVDQTETPMAEPQRDYPFADTLDSFIEQHQLYLNPALSLDELACQLHTNRTYLSDYFNRVKHTTFYDYVNELRIERKALPLMHGHPEYTIEYIAAESGFNSVSTFRRSFLKLKGVKPSKYRQQLQAATASS